MVSSKPSFDEGRFGALRRVVSPTVTRPTRFEDFRYLGDKRHQVVYDLDTDDAAATALIEELVASERFAAFLPDTLAEARNRGYRPHPSARPGDEA
jgi:hypothetical protein